MSGLSRRLRSVFPARRRRALLVSISVIVLFVVAVVLWIGHSPDDSDSAAGPLKPGATAPGLDASAPGSPTPSAKASAPASGSAKVSATKAGGLSLPALPADSSDIHGASHAHSVTLTVTADKPILRFAYVIREGHPPSGYRTFLRSPVSITTTAVGDGVLVEVGAQAAPGTTHLTCTVSIDGKTKSTNTVKGAYAIAFCIA